MSDWKNFSLGEIVEFNPVERIVKGTLAKKISMEKLQPFCREISGYELEKYNGGGTKFRNGDTIMARITPCLENGKTARIDVLDDDEIGFGSTEYIVFRAKENVTVPDFVYYLIRSAVVREPAIKSMVGTSGRQRVQTDYVKNIVIHLPPLETQKKIATVLSALDDKIELNNAINKNLEEQAQAIYKKICRRAKSAPLSELIEAVESGSRPKGGATISGIPSIGAEKIDGFGRYDYSNEKFISAGYFKRLKRGIVFSGDVMLYKDGAYTGKASMALDGFPHETCAVNEHVFLLRTKDNMTQFFLYFTLCNEDVYKKIHALACGKAAQPGLNRQELMCVTSFLPDEEVIQKFEAMVSPLMHAIALNALENKKLGELRDVLLPRLMSGEIDVSAVEI